MSIDNPHGGGEDYAGIIAACQSASELLWNSVIRCMVGVEGDERTGVRFAMYNQRGIKLAEWQTGELVEERVVLFQRNADNKCLAMHQARVVCSGIVADTAATPPIFDGGIKLDNGLYLACSGLRAELDRVYCMLVGRRVSQLFDLRFNTIMQRAPNEALVRSLHNHVFLLGLMRVLD